MEFKEFNREDMIKYGFLYIPPTDSNLPLCQNIEFGYKFNTSIRVLRFGKWVILKGWPGLAFIRSYKRKIK